MAGGSRERARRLTAAVIALTAAAMSLYVQLFEVRARQEEARLAALRLETALAESRSRLKAEILAELRAHPTAAAEEGPVPGAVLRRPEAAEGSGRAAGPALEPTLPAPPLTLSGLAEGLAALSQRTEEADRSLRRDLEELRVATRRETDAAAKAAILSLVALLALALEFLLSCWPDRQGKSQEGTAAHV